MLENRERVRGSDFIVLRSFPPELGILSASWKTSCLHDSGRSDNGGLQQQSLSTWGGVPSRTKRDARVAVDWAKHERLALDSRKKSMTAEETRKAKKRTPAPALIIGILREEQQPEQQLSMGQSPYLLRRSSFRRNHFSMNRLRPATPRLSP